jgi:nucleoside-diphosphate-sugar epimerase
MDVLHVSDVVAGLLAAERALASPASAAHDERPQALRRFTLTSGVARSLRDVVAAVEAAAGASLEVEWGARPYRAREVMMLRPATPPPPGWRPRIALEDGVRELLEERPRGEGPLRPATR